MNNKVFTITAIFISVVLIIGGIFYARTKLVTNKIVSEDDSTSTTPSTNKNNEKETYSYKNDNFGISFNYPSNWEGPAVFEQDNRLNTEIGTDNVYSYDTMLDERHYSIPNSYYIKVNVVKKPTDQSVSEYSKDNVSWIDPYLTNVGLKVGDSTNTTRITTTKLRDVTKGNFTGAEFLVTLSPQAQTEHVYQREIFLINENYDIVILTGYANNVEGGDTAEWRSAYQKVDLAHKEYFDEVFDSLEIDL